MKICEFVKFFILKTAPKQNISTYQLVEVITNTYEPIILFNDS